LKVAWRHPEAEHETNGLTAWAGNGAVRLYAAAQLTDTTVMLLERAVPGSALSAAPEPEQDLVITSLLRRLWVTPPPGHRFRPLAQMCEQWANQFDQKRAAGRVPNLDAGL